MSFVESNGVMGLVEELVSTVISKTVPHFDIPTLPFPRMTYAEAMEKVCTKMGTTVLYHYGYA